MMPELCSSKNLFLRVQITTNIFLKINNVGTIRLYFLPMKKDGFVYNILQKGGVDYVTDVFRRHIFPENF